jgi:hypothetical protein
MAMKGEMVMVVRLPVSEIVGIVAEQHHITLPLIDFRLDKDSLVLSFASSESREETLRSLEGMLTAEPETTAAPESRPGGPHPNAGRRSPRKKRHRMKTRGWEIVGTIKNSYGQTARVYRPFLDALSEKRLTVAQKRAVVAKVLRANGNRPTDSSIEYYLMNTMEFLEETQKKGAATSGVG